MKTQNVTTRFTLLFGCLVMVYLSSCTMKENAIVDTLPEPGSSFALLQENILTPNCATSGCHDSRNAVGGLDLSPAVAYKNLIGVEPTNPNAKADKLLRVKAGDPYKSFLYVKLDSANLHATDNYGSPMPLGSRSLTVGQLEFIKLWISGGAPKNGTAVDAALLKDTRSPNETLVLAPPASGEQFRIPLFNIIPRFEREISFAQRNPKDLLMTKFEMIQRDRSHHFVLYAYDTQKSTTLPTPGVIRDLYNTNGEYNLQSFLEMRGRIFILSSQLKAETISFPAGMAMRIPSTWLLELNSHYTNGTRDTIKGEVMFNIHSTTPDKVTTYIKPLELGTGQFLLPPQKETVVENTYLVGSQAMQRSGNSGNDRFESQDSIVHIIGLTSHTHRLAKRYVIQIVGGARNGEVVYTCTNWLNPPLVQYSTPIVLRRGEGLRSVVTYFNDTSEPKTFGFRSTDEMNIIFGYYY